MAKKVTSYKDFYRDFNNGITGSVLFFYGEENFLIRWAVDLIINSTLSEDGKSFCLAELDGAENNLETITATAMTVSMFGGKRVVVVRDFKPLYSAPDRATQKYVEDKLLDLAGKRSDSYVIIFTLDRAFKPKMTSLAKKLAAVRETGYEFPRLERNELRSFVRKRVNAGGRYVNDRVLDYILDLSGYFLRESNYTLDEMDKDVSKLVNASDDEITRELAEEVMIGESEKYAFALVDAVMAGDKSKALTIVENILADDDYASMRIISLLTGQFEMMYDAMELDRKRMSVREMAKVLGVNEYRLNRAYGSARRMPQGRIKEILIDLYNIDKAIKTGDLDKNIALELFVLK